MSMSSCVFDASISHEMEVPEFVRYLTEATIEVSVWSLASRRSISPDGDG